MAAKKINFEPISLAFRSHLLRVPADTSCCRRRCCFRSCLSMAIKEEWVERGEYSRGVARDEVYMGKCKGVGYIGGIQLARLLCVTLTKQHKVG